MNIRCNSCFEIYDNSYNLCPHCGYIPGTPAHEPYHLSPGTVLAGRYIIGKVLGFGGFGITYKAWDTKLDSVVAVKEYFPCGVVNRQPNSQKVVVLSSKSRREFDFGLVRIIEEARNMAQFNSNKNIVNVFEYFEENNTAYIIMEFLDGCTLSEYMEENGGIIPVEKSIDIVLNVTAALKVIHKNSIIHRDISPDNIYLCKNGNIKLIDFGAAKFSAAQQESHYTIILKPGFAPPEQYEQVSKQGPWTDIYALGATLYYMITGKKPDESTNRKVGDTLADPVKVNPAIPMYVSDAVMKAMALESDMRFSTAESFEQVLRQEKKVVPVKKEKRAKRNKRMLGLVAVFAVVLLAAGILGMDFMGRKSASTLEDAEITVWYIDNGNAKENEAYENIVSLFCDEYENIDVELAGIPAEEYNEKIQKAMKEGEAPNVFISDGFDEDELKDLYDLTDVVYPQREIKFSLIAKFTKDKIRNDCLFFENYEDISDGGRVPVGFNMPVVYINENSILSGKELPQSVESIKDITKLIGENDVIVVNPDFEEIFKDIFGEENSDRIRKGGKELFLTGEAAVYFSDTSEFFEIRKMTTMNVGIPAVLPVESDDTILYSHYFSALDVSDDNENEAAEEFISFMLSSAAQNELFSKGKSGALPLNKKAIKSYVQIYGDLSFIIPEKEDE